MKVAILGGTGLLGKALVRAWSGDEVIGLGSRDVDIRDPQKVREVVNAIRPDWIVWPRLIPMWMAVRAIRALRLP